MPISNDKMPAKKLVLFFVVDTSTSMEGGRIGALNNAVEEILPMVGEISQKNNDAKIEIAVLQFSSGVSWLYPQPVPVEGFSWRTLTAEGCTDFGEACKELALRLTRKEGGFMRSASSSFAPVFILLSDGYPTDNYKPHLQTLKDKNWFKAGIKIAIAAGDDADVNVLAEFTGSKESVFTVHNVKALRKIIRCVIVTSSMVASNDPNTSGTSKQEKTVKEVKTEIGEEIDKGTITLADTTGGVSAKDDWE